LVNQTKIQTKGDKTMNDFNSTLTVHCGAKKINRLELRAIETPESTRTHQPLSHFEVVETLIEALSFRYVKVVRDEYAVSIDGMKMFGVMDLSTEFNGGRFSIGLRNSNDKSMRLALTVGYRVFVCDNMAFSGDFTPMFQKHTKNLSLMDSISIAVDRIYRSFEPLKTHLKQMREIELQDQQARLLIYKAFLDREIRGIPRHLLPIVHDYYFHPKQDAFRPRNLWSLSNAFTSAFKKLSPLKQFEVTAKLGSFMQNTEDELLNTDKKVVLLLGDGNQSFNESKEDFDDFDEDDIPDDPFDDEDFDRYFDEAEASEEIDEATEKLVEKYEMQAA
jgi:hypothetical protein